MHRLLPVAIISIFLVAAGSAQAAPVVTGVFDLPDKPTQNPPALGPDGNVWVTLEQNVGPDFAKVAPDGTVTPINSPDITGVHGITAGPDGNMWVTGTNFVGRFSPATPETVTKFPTASIGSSNHIVVGPDGNLWTGSDGSIVRVTPTASPTITPFPSGVAGFAAKGIASDGTKLWVANGDAGNAGLLPVTTAGVAGPLVPIAGQIQQVTAGANGQLAYTNPGATPEKIGLVNGGVPATPFDFAVPPDPFGITLGQDGAYWVGLFNSPAVGRYTSDGQFSTVEGLPANAGGRMIARGSGDTMWVPLELVNKIARISGIEPPDSTPPAITKLKLTHTVFKISSKKTALTARSRVKVATGTTVKFNLSEAGTVKIAIEKAASGRKSGKKCVKPTSKLRKAKKCTRYVAYKKVLTRTGKLGANRVAFTGRFGKTKLKHGRYRFSITAVDAKGNTSKPSTTKFTVMTK